jgi:PKD repeat protein
LVAFTDKSEDPTEWLWDFGDGATSDEQNPIHQYTENGVYTVSLAATNEFGTDVIVKEDLITVEIPEAPEIADIIVCIDEEFEITLELEGVAHWYVSIDDEEPVYIGNEWMHPAIEDNTTYFLCEVIETPEGSVDEFCTSFFAEVLIIPETCVSIAENHLGNITIYPNPTDGKLTVGMSDLRYEICDITIYDVFGREQITLNSQLSTLNSIDISHLPTGVYFIRITTEEGTVTKKIVKQQ